MPRQGAFASRAAALAAAALSAERCEDGWGLADGPEVALAVASVDEVQKEEPRPQDASKAVPAACGWAAANEPQMGKDVGHGYYQALLERQRAREAAEKEEEAAKVNEYVADNSQLQAQAPGITYRCSKRMEDRDDSAPLAYWGTVVAGADEGDGWLKVGEHFLPMTVQGHRVLTLRSRFSGPIVSESMAEPQDKARMEERARKRERMMRRQMAKARKRAEDHYGLLGVPRRASTEEIAQAYRALCKLYHPDKAVHADEQGRQARERHMRALNEAYEVLGDARRRAAYDRGLPPDASEAAAAEADAAAAAAAPSQARERRREPKVEDFDFDFSGDGRPFRLARGRASRVCAECGTLQRKEQVRLAMQQLRGKERMELAERRGVVRHIGHNSPFTRLGECGLGDCFANRCARPEVRAQFRDFIVGRVRDADRAGTGWWGANGLRYASVGSGELLFDTELLERIRELGIRIDQVCLIDQEYRAPRVGAKGALREFADWQRASSEIAKEEPAEILAFGRLSDYYATAKPGGRAADCHLMVHCDAHWEGAFEDCDRLAQRALVKGGMLARLATGDGEWQGEAAGAPSMARLRGNLAGVFCGDPPEEQELEEAAERPPPWDIHGAGAFTMAAWAVEPMPPETFRPPLLLPLDDPRLNAPSKSMALRRAEERGLAVWRVVHNPRIAVRDRPATQGKVLDVFYAGDELVVTGETIGPWLRLSEMTWADISDAPREAWALTDGTSVGLGVLLEQVYDPEAAKVQLLAAAAADSAEDTGSSGDEALLERGA